MMTILRLFMICLITTALFGCSPAPKGNDYFAPITDKQPEQSIEGGVKVHFIDVGQGASQLIIGPTGKTILIDAGNNDKEGLIVAYLKKENIKRIDILIGTHPDADHIGGLDAVIDHFEIGSMYMPKIQSNTKTFEDVLVSVKNKGLKVSTAKAGVKLNWEADAEVSMVAPVEAYDDTNNMSAVVHLSYKDVSFLLTGDAEALSEQDMLKSKADLKSDILLVGHHGSESSTSKPFLDAVQPSYAVIQVGPNNYGHPTPGVLNRLNDKGVNIYRNDKDGNVIFATDGKKISVTLSSASPQGTNNRQQNSGTVYNSCKEAKAAGKAPLYKGDPGYSTKLDGDLDGKACE